MAAKTLNSNTSPSASAMRSDSFQSNCICSPGAVSKRGWGSGPSGGRPHSMPLRRIHLVSVL